MVNVNRKLQKNSKMSESENTMTLVGEYIGVDTGLK